MSVATKAAAAYGIDFHIPPFFQEFLKSIMIGLSRETGKVSAACWDCGRIILERPYFYKRRI